MSKNMFFFKLLVVFVNKNIKIKDIFVNFLICLSFYIGCFVIRNCLLPRKKVKKGFKIIFYN